METESHLDTVTPPTHPPCRNGPDGSQRTLSRPPLPGRYLLRSSCTCRAAWRRMCTSPRCSWKAQRFGSGKTRRQHTVGTGYSHGGVWRCRSGPPRTAVAHCFPPRRSCPRRTPRIPLRYERAGVCRLRTACTPRRGCCSRTSLRCMPLASQPRQHTRSRPGSRSSRARRPHRRRCRSGQARSWPAAHGSSREDRSCLAGSARTRPPLPLFGTSPPRTVCIVCCGWTKHTTPLHTASAPWRPAGSCFLQSTECTPRGCPGQSRRHTPRSGKAEEHLLQPSNTSLARNRGMRWRSPRAVVCQPGRMCRCRCASCWRTCRAGTLRGTCRRHRN